MAAKETNMVLQCVAVWCSVCARCVVTTHVPPISCGEGEMKLVEVDTLQVAGFDSNDEYVMRAPMDTLNRQEKKRSRYS